MGSVISHKHLSLYPGDEATSEFADELVDYRVSKGTIRFPYEKDLPTDLIVRISLWCYEKYSK